MAQRDEELLQELLQTFYVEAAEHVQTLNQTLLKLEREKDDQKQAELIREAFRTAHSLKGAARAVSMEQIEKLAHGMEDVLKLARDGGMTLDPNTCDVLYSALDVVQHMLKGGTFESEPLLNRLETLTQQATPKQNGNNGTPKLVSEPISEAPAAPHANDNDDTIRVAVAKLDALMAQAGELIVTKISAEQRLTELQNLRQQLALYPKMWREIKNLLPRVSATGDAGRQLVELLNRQYDNLQSLSKDFNTFDQSFSRDTLRLNMVTGRIQDEVRRTRMIPFQTLEPLLLRTVRDAARSDSKQVSLTIDGSDVELDKKVLETLKDPLIHLLRNSVGHGLETPDDRFNQGKPAEGHIHISVVQRGGEVRISVSDDGRGFDLDALKLAGGTFNGHLSGEATPDDIIALAFLPGVTTADRVTSLSGRGVGLDVVRQRLESLQGRIFVESTPCVGSTIRLIVPVSLAMARVLLVRVGKERYALPLASVEKITTPTNTYTTEGRAMMTLNGAPIPLVSLAAALERPTELETQRPLAVVMGSGQQRLALLVDDVITEQELAIKPLGKPLLRVRNITGAAVLGNGEPVFVLNSNDLIKSARSVRGHTIAIETGNKEIERPIQNILVVDDSITTRTLEKNILEAAGYKVITATDGVEALQQLRKYDIALVVADVEMPNMDGITLTRFVRESNEFKDMPLILVTSLESREDRENGMTAGANAYIVKRGFNQAELLSTIQQLLS